MNILNLLACSTCSATFGASGDSIGYSIFFLLLVILAVLGGVAFFMIRLARRELNNLDPELRDDYVHR
jgi:hypothetical protein